MTKRSGSCGGGVPRHPAWREAGEKLLGTGEVAEPSTVAGILQVQLAQVPVDQMLLAQLAALERLAFRSDVSAVLQQLRVIVSDYQQDADIATVSTSATG